MAINTLPGRAGDPSTRLTPPPLDTVLAWVTNTIELDYEARGVFPGVRRATSRELRPVSSMHCLTPAQAVTPRKP